MATTERWLATSRRGLACVALLTLILPLSSGCGSSSIQRVEVDAAGKVKDKPKSPFERLQITPEPNERVFIDLKEKGSDVITRPIKPGHWVDLLVTTAANRFDFSGELALSAYNAVQSPIPLEQNPWTLSTRRGVALAKAQRKTLEALFFPPCSPLRTSTVVSGTLSSDRGDQSFAGQELLPHMPSYQYFLCVLAREPARYGYWKTLDCNKLSEVWSDLPEETSYYRVLLAGPVQPFPLPSSVLCWSAMAQVVWDDFSPGDLSADQQQAMIDWLHWGGSLVVSGPQSLDALASSFLAPYLPATSAGAALLDQQAFAELNAHWSVAAGAAEPEPLRVSSPLSGVALRVANGGAFVPGTGELVAIRQAGRGRVLATAFRLTDRELTSWPSFDSFANGALLGRLPRRFDVEEMRYDFVELDSSESVDPLDPNLSTAVRFLSRDLPGPDSARPKPTIDELAALAARTNPIARYNTPPSATGTELAGLEMDRYKSEGGTAAWNDFSGISEAARTTLRNAAGISVPDRQLVFAALAGYLLVVGPLNWLFFWLVGRVEWAWVAVPIFAVGGGGLVVWLAQLDIGFARSQTEVDVIELHADYPRGHLTRYTALYTSLATGYQIQFDQPGVLAQPFSAGVELLAGQAASPATLTSAAGMQLSGYSVGSNSTGMIHSEQMIDLGGVITWNELAGKLPVLQNHTRLNLSGAAAIRRSARDADAGALEFAWLDDLNAGATRDVEFDTQPNAARRLADRRWYSEGTRLVESIGRLTLVQLVSLVESREALAPGDVRLVAWMPDCLPGMTIEPASPDPRRMTVVVAHLRRAARSCRPDFNLRTRPGQDADAPGESAPPVSEGALP